MSSTLLNLTNLTTTMGSKEQVVSTNIFDIERSLTSRLNLDLSTNRTLNLNEYTRNVHFNCTPVTGTRDLVVPDVDRIFYVKNNGTGNIVVRRSTGTTVTIAATEGVILANSSTGIKSILTDKVGRFIELADAPSSYTNSADKLLTVNSAGTAIEFGIRNNMNATTNPLVTSDSSLGYSVGSVWFNSISNIIWICKNASVGAAVWEQFLSRRVFHAGYGSSGHSATSILSVSANPQNEELYLYPFRIYDRVTLNEMFTVVTTAGGADSVIKFAIWDNDYSTGLPTGTPVAGNNTSLATNTTGIKSSVITLNARPGIYWIGSVLFTSTTTPFIPCIPQTQHLSTLIAPTGALANEAISSTNIAAAGFNLEPNLLFTTDIMTVNLTGATFSRVISSQGRVPHIGIGW